MSTRGFYQLNMLQTTESQYSWGGTDYTSFALESGTTIPTGLGTTNTKTFSRDDQPSVVDATADFNFIFPTTLDAISIIDGTISGTLKLGDEIIDAGAATITLTKAEVTLKAIDDTGSSRNITEKKEIWSGTIVATSLGGAVNKQVMYWIDVEDAIISASERVVIDFTITFTTVDASANSQMRIYVYCTPSSDETTITLPFVM